MREINKLMILEMLNKIKIKKMRLRKLMIIKIWKIRIRAR